MRDVLAEPVLSDYDGGNVISEVAKADGRIVRRFVWGPNPDELVAQYEGGQRLFADLDERGSVLKLTDDKQVPTAINAYDEYGIPQPGNAGRVQYTGQRWIASFLEGGTEHLGNHNWYGSYMDECMIDYPPFSKDGEKPVDDLEFLKKCEKAIVDISHGHDDVRFCKMYLTENSEFGRVCRVDFISIGGIENAVNRIMLWYLEDGSLAQFTGFSIPAEPFEE